jgi:hypothetical protein
MAFVSSSSGIVIVDSRSNSGSIRLPAASTLVGRSLIFKDGFNSFGSHPLGISTTGVDIFDNLSSVLTVGETNGFLSLVAGSNKWHTVGGTYNAPPPQNLNISSITFPGLPNTNFNTSYSYGYIEYGSTLIVYPSTFTYFSSFSTFSSPITIVNSTMMSNLLTVTSNSININGSPYSPPYFQTSALDLDYQVLTSVVPSYNFSNNSLKTIAYGNGKWLAAGEGSVVNVWNYSNAWSTIVGNCNILVNSLSYNNNQWLAVGSNSIMVSYDGYSWLNTATFTPAVFNTVAYNSTFWLAGGYSACNIGSIQLSADGFNWYAHSTIIPRVNSIAYASNLWVAVGSPGSTIQTSYDGSNWTPQTSIFQQGNTVTYGNGFWLAGGFDPSFSANSIQTSADGSNWTSRSNQLKVVNSIAYNAGRSVAVGINASTLFNAIETSTDGINWQSVSTNIAVGQTVAYGNNRWIAGGYTLTSSPIIEYSLDGIIWTSNINYFQNYSTILTTQSNNLLINGTPIIGNTLQTTTLIASNLGLTYDSIIYSQNQNIYAPTSNYSNVNAIVYANNLLMIGINAAFGTLFTGTIQILNNNVWVSQTNEFLTINGIDYGNGLWVSVGQVPGGLDIRGIQISIDGSNWIPTPSSSNSLNPGYCVKYANGLWLAGNFYGNGDLPSNAYSMQRSTDGYNWSLQSNQLCIVRKINYGGGLWVAVGENPYNTYTIQTSIDGSNWTLQSYNQPQYAIETAYSVAYGNNLWLVGGYTNFGNNEKPIGYSSDGSNWSPVAGFLNPVYDIAYNDGIWLAVGTTMTSNANKCIQTSLDGLFWTVQTASQLICGKSIGYSNGVWIVGGHAPFGDGGHGPENKAFIEYSYDTINWTSTFITSTIKTASTILTGDSNSLFLNGVALSTTGNLQPQNLTSTIKGLGTSGYLSSGVQALDLASTVQGIDSSAIKPSYIGSTIRGLGTFGYLSTGIQKADLTSSIKGLGTFGYLSSPTRYITDSFCVAGGVNYHGQYCLQASYDGFNWQLASNQPFGGTDTGQVNGVSFNGSYWVASGNGDCRIAISYDGFNWLASSNDPFGSNGVARASAWNGSYWVVVGNSTDSSVTAGISYDGINWTSSINNPLSNGGGTGIAWNGYIWVGTGSNYLTSNGVVLTNTTASIVISSDGMNWFKASNDVFVADIPYSAEANGIAWNGSYWVAVGRAQALGSALTVAVSPDGYNWTAASNNPFSAPSGGGTTISKGNKIAWTGSKWLAVGVTASNEYSMAVSTDGYNWTYPSANPFTGGTCTGITWNGSYWIACANTGSIATSPDTINWTLRPTSVNDAARLAVASRIVLPYLGKNIIPAATTNLYIPANPGIWVSPPPSTIQAAIDRLASFLSAFTTSNIPI